MKFILILVVILGLFLLLRAFKKSAQSQDIRAIPRFGDTLAPLIEEAVDLSAQGTAMPFQIFQLAGKLAPHPNKDEVIARGLTHFLLKNLCIMLFSVFFMY